MKVVSACMCLFLYYLFLAECPFARAEDKNVEKVEQKKAVLEQYRVECVEKINSFRASEGKVALKRWTNKEQCSDLSAKKESTEKRLHVSFQDCGELAQNICPGYVNFKAVIDGCVPEMWNEGPGKPFSKHGHYLNMSNAKYTKVACGFFTDSKGKIWHIENFR